MAKLMERYHRARSLGVRAASMAVGGLAVVTLLGLTPTVATAATGTFFVRGTDTGYFPPDAVWQTWVDHTVGAICGDHGTPNMVDYPAAFWPVSNGFFGDPTFGDSVADGVAGLAAVIADGDGTGVFIHGYSQGAAVATEYLRTHPGAGNTYILAANPNRPNGGFLTRFSGMYIPILDVSFTGATPTDGETVIDIARQYDGWADFPKYPLNLLATANALLGIAFLHGPYNIAVTAEVLAGLEPTTHGNTSYYLVPTPRLPLLMPLQGLLPDKLLDAIDRPLREFIETAYDRTDYGVPTPAAIIPTHNPTPTAIVAPPADSQAAEGVSPVPEHDGTQKDDTDEPVRQRRVGWSPQRSLPSAASEDTSGKADNTPDGTDVDAPREHVRPTKKPKPDHKKKEDVVKSTLPAVTDSRSAAAAA